MTRLLGILLATGFVLGTVAAATTSSFAGSYGYSGGSSYHAPKKAYTVYGGDYPGQCYPEPTYDPPGGYAEGCYPPPDWIAYCSGKYNSFNEANGYYLGYDSYYHYCR